jgi:hypothetical protein
MKYVSVFFFTRKRRTTPARRVNRSIVLFASMHLRFKYTHTQPIDLLYIIVYVYIVCVYGRGTTRIVYNIVFTYNNSIHIYVHDNNDMTLHLKP